MSYTTLAQSAVDWALSKVGCAYSQAKRTQEDIFDCSSLVARAYSAQGKRWKYGGSVPTSNKEIYDDDFELLWPTTYAQIGKSFGGASVINMARQPGDLQFLCTDSGTSRANKITHVTMVATPTQIVHARGTKYGVCTNSISLYAGKVCGVVRYNPACALRLGMKGYRTLRLQQALNAHGADIREDGEFGEKTQKALKVFQADHGCGATGETDLATLNALGLNAEVKPLSQSTGSEPSNQNPILVTGGSVHIRTGPGKEYDSVMIAHAGDVLHGIDAEGWNPSCWTAKCAGSARSTVRCRTPDPHNDRPPRQETGVEGFLLLGADEPNVHSLASNRRMISHEVSGSRSNSARASSLAAICQAKWRRGTDRKRRANNAFSRTISSSCPRRAHIS